MAVGPDEKFCWKCRRCLPVDVFGAHSKNPDGKRIDCLRCDAAAARVARRRARLKAQIAA